MYLYYKDGLRERGTKLGNKIDIEVQNMWLVEIDNGVTYEIECESFWIETLMELHFQIVSAVRIDNQGQHQLHFQWAAETYCQQ